MTSDRRTAIAVLAIVAVLGGLAGLVNALDAAFFADRGDQLLRLYAMNAFAGLVTIIGGLIALGASALRSKPAAGLAGLIFLAEAGLTLIALGQTYNLFGGRASTVVFWLMLGIGFTALAVSPEVSGAIGPRADESESRSRAG